jgi:phosphomannomutase
MPNQKSIPDQTFHLSISGLRALVDKETPRLFFQFAQAFTKTLGKGTYLLATDTRPSRNTLLPEVVAGITSVGSDVVTIGIAPTPVVLFLVRKMNFTGGIVLTASHNPIEYNGLKFIGPDGIFLSEEGIARVQENLERGEEGAGKRKGSHTHNPNLIEIYIENLLGSKIFSGVSFKNLFCLVDACNGAVYYLLDQVLERIGCRVSHIYSPDKGRAIRNGLFPRPPEPSAENLFKLKQEVLKEEGDLGIAYDPDGDRVSFVSEEGKALGEEATLPLALEFFLPKEKSPVVCNLSTSLLVDAIAERYGVKTYRTKVGERNVIEEMMKRGAKIGGEGNGGVILSEINFTRDGILATLMILALLSERGKLSTIARSFPRFWTKKFSFPYSPERKEIFPRLIEETKKILSQIGEVKEDSRDGLWLGNEKVFCHFRPSRTEPLFRIIICAEKRKITDEIKDLLAERLGGEV